MARRPSCDRRRSWSRSSHLLSFSSSDGWRFSDGSSSCWALRGRTGRSQAWTHQTKKVRRTQKLVFLIEAGLPHRSWSSSWKLVFLLEAGLPPGNWSSSWSSVRGDVEETQGSVEKCIRLQQQSDMWNTDVPPAAVFENYTFKCFKGTVDLMLNTQHKFLLQMTFNSLLSI